MSASASPSTKEKKRNSFRDCYSYYSCRAQLFFCLFLFVFFFTKSHRIDRSEGRTNNNNNKHITRRKRVSGLSISRVLTTSWAWHGRQNLFFSILFGCLTCFLQFAFIRLKNDLLLWGFLIQLDALQRSNAATTNNSKSLFFFFFFFFKKSYNFRLWMKIGALQLDTVRIHTPVHLKCSSWLSCGK